VADPELLPGVLSRALGVTHTAEKTRVLYLVGQTRVHLDSVDGLGDFLELEGVLRPGQNSAEGQAIAADLMQRLGIHQASSWQARLLRDDLRGGFPSTQPSRLWIKSSSHPQIWR